MAKNKKKLPSYRQAAKAQKVANRMGNQTLISAFTPGETYQEKRSQGKGILRSAFSAAAHSAGNLVKGVVQKAAATMMAPYVIGKGIHETLFNHPEWYTNYAEGTKLIGANFGLRKKVGIDSPTNVNPKSTIARIDLELVIPVDRTGSFVQGVNYAYAKIRAANAGSVNYRPGDLAEYILNVRGIRAALAQLRRIRASANNFNVYDADAPGLLTSACGMARKVGDTYYGVDYGTIRANMAEVDNFLTNAYMQVRNLIPLNIPLLDRTDWLFSNIFADSDDAKASHYVFTCPEINLFQYNSENNKLSKHMTINFAWSGNTNGFDTNLHDIMDAINDAIGAFSGDATSMIIAGDILKAFGQQAFYNATNYDLNVPAPVLYDEYALTQIQNAVLNHSDIDTISVNMTTGDVTVRGPRSEGVTTGFNNRNFVNWFKDEITPGELLSCTRLISFKETQTGNIDVYTTCGFEIALNMFICVGLGSDGIYQYDNMAVDETNTDLYRLPYLAAFWSILDWAPRLTSAAVIQGETNTFDMWDYNNYAELTEEQTSQFHQVATLSLLYTGNEPVERHMGFKFLD